MFFVIIVVELFMFVTDDKAKWRVLSVGKDTKKPRRDIYYNVKKVIFFPKNLELSVKTSTFATCF
jgi:hypothetical protein